MKKTRVLLLAALFGATAAQANDLLTVYREAVAYDAQFAAAKASLAAGKEKEAQGLSGLLPTEAVRFLGAMGDEDRERLLETLDADLRTQLRELMSYTENTAGSATHRMTTPQGSSPTLTSPSFA